jgi:hypothetical protein
MKVLYFATSIILIVFSSTSVFSEEQSEYSKTLFRDKLLNVLDKRKILSETPSLKHSAAQDFSKILGTYNLSQKLNLRFQLSFEIKRNSSNFSTSYQERSHPFISLAKNWYLPIQNWGSIAKFYEMELSHAKNSRSSFLLGLFQQIERQSKIGFGLHYTDLSDNVSNDKFSSQGFFINYIVEY